MGLGIFLQTQNHQSLTETRISEVVIGVGGDHRAWDILISKLDFQSQMKIAQQNQRLADAVQVNAEHEIRKFRSHIRDDKYM